MTHHLTDEQLDAVMESVTDARAYGQATMVYTEDRIRHETYVSLSTDVVEDLITALRRERAAHQATQAELEARVNHYIEMGHETSVKLNDAITQIEQQQSEKDILVRSIASLQYQVEQQQAELEEYRKAFQRWESKIDRALDAARAGQGEGAECG